MSNLGLVWGALKSTYDLKRENFGPNPATDCAIYFGRSEVRERIVEEIRSSFSQAICPKIVVQGGWGYGKTHTLYHLKYLLENDATCVYVSLPDIDYHDDFINGFYRFLMDAMNSNNALEAIVRDVREKGVLSKYVEDQLLFSAFDGMIVSSLARRETYKNWLMGREISSADQKDTNLPKRIDVLKPDACVEVLRCLGNMFLDTLRVLGKQSMLFFLVDEAHRLERISLRNKSKYYSDWYTAFKILVHDSYPVGMVFSVGYSVGAAGAFQIDLLQYPEIASRMGSRWIQLAPIPVPELESFITSVTSYSRDGWDMQKKTFNAPSQAVTKAVTAWNNAHSAEPTDIHAYPFTKRALQNILETLPRQPADFRSPRVICKLMNDLAAYSNCLKRRMVTQADFAPVMKRLQQQQVPTPQPNP